MLVPKELKKTVSFPYPSFYTWGRWNLERALRWLPQDHTSLWGESSSPVPSDGLVTLGSFVLLSWLLVRFPSGKTDVAAVSRLAEVVFYSILTFGLSSLLNGNALTGSLPDPAGIHCSQGSLESPLFFSSLLYLVVECLIFCFLCLFLLTGQEGAAAWPAG